MKALLRRSQPASLINPKLNSGIAGIRCKDKIKNLKGEKDNMNIFCSHRKCIIVNYILQYQRRGSKDIFNLAGSWRGGLLYIGQILPCPDNYMA